MKTILLLFFNFAFVIGFSQQLSSINSGASSSNDLIYSVGEIFVLPVSEVDESSSGIIGALSRIAFFVEDSTTIGIISQENLGFYPNPTQNVVYFDVAILQNQPIQVFDVSGKLVAIKQIENQQINLSEIPPGNYMIQFPASNITPIKIIKN